MSTKADICFHCGHKMTTRRENVPFLGLPDTTLLGVNVSRCHNCGEHEVEIPMLEELHQGLALQVVEKTGRLSGAEIKFLRTVLACSSAAFARLVGASRIVMKLAANKWKPTELRAA